MDSKPITQSPQCSHDNSPEADGKAKQFLKHWQSSTDANNITLHGFRRYKTTHLMNLRYLEDEISVLDHKIYQAGMNFGPDPGPYDRLGLKHAKRDMNVPDVKEVTNQNFILKLRELIQQYGKFCLEI